MDSAGLSRWPEVLMLAQVVLLYLLTTQLAKIQSQLKLVLTSAAVASVPAAAGGEVQPQQAKPSESFRCRTCATHASFRAPRARQAPPRPPVHPPAPSLSVAAAERLLRRRQVGTQADARQSAARRAPPAP